MKLVAAALVGAFVALAVVGGLAVLDRTTLHWYADDEPSTLWYYVEVGDAGDLTDKWGPDLPPCLSVLQQYPDPLPASPYASPRHIGDVERVAIECKKPPYR